MKLSDKNNLKFNNPELAEEWHPYKNGDLTPDKVTPYSQKKVWWICEEDHEWEATVLNRNNGSGCPYCAGRIATEDYNLSVVFPGVAKQWHPTKNRGLTPDKVTPGSSKKVWWLCERGHEWKTSVSLRTSSGTSCPYCVRRKLNKKTVFSSAYPDVAKQWHPYKNKPSGLTPDKVSPFSNKKVWWLCESGHEWMASVASRSRSDICPYCIGLYASPEYNLQVINPGLARQWHPTKNGNLTPDKVTPGSGIRAWWLCDKGHEWTAIVGGRNKGSNCPYCAGRYATKEKNLLKVYPGIAKEWHPYKNKPSGLTPGKVSPFSTKKVWWQCDKGHEWQARIQNRTKKGNGCPYCSGRKASKEYNLLVVYPRIANQWHPYKNKPSGLTPGKVSPFSNKKVWWQCDKGHEWQARINNRSNGTGCPYCSGKKTSKEYNLLVVYPRIANQWHPVKNGELTPDKVMPKSNKKAWWICDKGHEWKAVIASRTGGNRGCPHCYKERMRRTLWMKR